MNIGLIDVDGHNSFPNYALMKLSKWHKMHGDNVEFAVPLLGASGYYDRVYKSKVFTFTPDDLSIYDCDVIKGGTGYGIMSELPPEIDRLQPDYSLYGISDYAIGFTTRGCCNNCKWCVVPRKEGKTRPYMDIREIADGNHTKRIILMDNNALSSDHGIEQMEIAIANKYRVDYNQGLDARRVDNEVAGILARLKYIRYVRFACDNVSQIDAIKNAVELMTDKGYTGCFFIYVLLTNDFAETYRRISALYGLNYFYDDKIIMHCQPYSDFTDALFKPPQWQKDIAQWANRRWFYRSVWVDDFEPRKGFRCGEYKKCSALMIDCLHCARKLL